MQSSNEFKHQINKMSDSDGLKQLSIDDLKKHVDTQDTDALYELANRYYYGVRGVDKNIVQAKKTLKKSVKLNHIESINLLAKILYFEGSAKNKKCIKLLKIGTKQNNAFSMYLLSSCYIREKQDRLSLYWLAKSAALKLPVAVFELGKAYYHGSRGLDKNIKQGIFIIKQASDIGSSGAKCFLGDLYCQGDVFEKNLEKAISYFRQIKPSDAFSKLLSLFLREKPNDTRLKYYTHLARVSNEQQFNYYYYKKNDPKLAAKIFDEYNVPLTDKLPLWLDDIKSECKIVHDQAKTYCLPLSDELDSNIHKEEDAKKRNLYLIYRGYISWFQDELNLDGIAKYWGQLSDISCLADNKQLADDIIQICNLFYFSPIASHFITKAQCQLIALITSHYISQQGDRDAVVFFNMITMSESQRSTRLYNQWLLIRDRNKDTIGYQEKLIKLLNQFIVELDERVTQDISQCSNPNLFNQRSEVIKVAGLINELKTMDITKHINTFQMKLQEYLKSNELISPYKVMLQQMVSVVNEVVKAQLVIQASNKDEKAIPQKT